MDLVFTNVSERIPDCNGSHVRVYIKKTNGSTSIGGKQNATEKAR